MKQMRPTLKKDYSGLFVGTILMALVVIVFELMMAIAQSRARSAPRVSNAVLQGANSTLTSTIYSGSHGTF